MVPPALEPLLVFQDRDRRRVALEVQVRHVPEEIASVKRRIEEDRAGVEAARTAWRESEARRKSLETEIGSVEQRIARLKTQQLEVRKNEEYQALGHEIETGQTEILAFEEQELTVLYAIDAAKDRVKAAEAEAARSIGLHEARIRTLEEKAGTLQQELGVIQAELAAARAVVPEAMLAIYTRLLRNTALPVCVPLRDQKCTGCHLKVSGGVFTGARTGGNTVVCCDNCGRIVYWEG